MTETKIDKLCKTVECIGEDVTLIKDNMVGNKLKNIPSIIDTVSHVPLMLERQNEHHEWIEKQKNKFTVKKFFSIILKAITT